MPEPCRQFVILHHVLADGEHWDLMLDRGEVLATWQLMQNPASLASAGRGQAIPTRRIGDHRRSYLEYEGPVSGNRGHVTHFDHGAYELMSEQGDAWTLRLTGQQVAGLFRLGPLDSGSEGIIQRLE